MRFRIALAFALLAGCAHEPDYPRGTIRVIGGRRVLGRYISPSAYQHYIQAQLYANNEQHELAADELRQAIASDPDAPDLHVRLAEELTKLGRLDAADMEIEQALRIDKKDAAAYLAQAALRHAKNDLKGAIASYQAATEAEPTNEDAWIELARAQHEAGDAKASRQALADLVKNVPSSVDGHYHLANALAGTGDVPGGMAELRKTLDLEPGHTDARVRLGDLLVQSGQLEEGIAVLRDGLERADDPLPVAEGLIEILLRRGELDEARDVVMVIDHGERDPARATALANLFRAVKLPARARELVDGALRIKPDFDRGRLLSAALYEEAKDNSAAISEYEKIGSDSREFAEAVRRACELLVKGTKLTDAANLAERAAQKRPEDDEVLVVAAEVDEKRGDPAHAVARLEKALSARPKSETLIYGLASIVDRTGDWRRAVDIMQRVLAINPRSANALNFIGYAYAEHGVDLDKSEKMLRQAIQLAPGNGYIVDSLGWCLFKQGKTGDALRMLQEADRLAPNEAEILRHLGDVQFTLKDRTAAAEAYKRALAAQPDEKLRREIEDSLHELEAGRSARSK